MRFGARETSSVAGPSSILLWFVVVVVGEFLVGCCLSQLIDFRVTLE